MTIQERRRAERRQVIRHAREHGLDRITQLRQFDLAQARAEALRDAWRVYPEPTQDADE